MFRRRLGYEVAILAAICTICIFLFPASTGPYSAVHGPVTALLTLRVRLKLWLGMALAVLHLLVVSALAALRTACLEVLLPQLVPPEITVLRC